MLSAMDYGQKRAGMHIAGVVYASVIFFIKLGKHLEGRWQAGSSLLQLPN